MSPVGTERQRSVSLWVLQRAMIMPSSCHRLRRVERFQYCGPRRLRHAFSPFVDPGQEPVEGVSNPRYAKNAILTTYTNKKAP